MNVIVRCPSCDRPATVAEADVFEAPVTCADCGTVYEPDTATPDPESGPAGPKIPGYGPRGIVRRPAPTRPRESAEQKAAAKAFTRRAIVIGSVGVIGLAAAGSAGLWAVRRANRAAANGANGAVGDGWRAYPLPEAPEVTVEFPAPPSAVDERIDIFDWRQKVTDRSSFRAFKCELPNGETYAVRVDEVHGWLELRARSDAERRKEYMLAFAKLLRGAGLEGGSTAGRDFGRRVRFRRVLSSRRRERQAGRVPVGAGLRSRVHNVRRRSGRLSGRAGGAAASSTRSATRDSRPNRPLYRLPPRPSSVPLLASRRTSRLRSPRR